MRSVVVGTAGHIDHGKSALVQALTGTNPDRLKEEQARGITIDLGFAHFREAGADVALVDVPGHERFVRNMLAGAGGIDAVMLVVAADESVMPQTREHFDICRLLGVTHGLVAVTKSDLVDEDTLGLVMTEVREAVAGSFLDGAPMLAVSARSGEGLPALRTTLAALAGVSPRQARAGLARLPVDRVFTVRGFGTVVTGTLVSGRVAENDELVALPDGRRVRVRGVQVHGETAGAVDAPSRVALNLGAVEVGDLARGVTLASAESLPVTRRAEVALALLESARPLAHGARVRVHHGTSEILARVAIAAVRARSDDPYLGAAPGQAGVTVPAGGGAYARLRFEGPAVLTRGDRVVLRAYSPPVTIGGALVLDPEPPRGRLRRAEAFARFGQLETAKGALRQWLAEAAGVGLEPMSVVRRAGLDLAAASEAMSSAAAAGWATSFGGRMFDSVVVADMEARLLAELTAFHAAHPSEAGLPRAELAQRVAAGSGDLFDDVATRLTQAGRVAGTDRLRLASHAPLLADEVSRAADAVRAAVEAAGLAPPDAAALAQEAGVPAAKLENLLARLAREQKLVRLDGLPFHPARLERLREEISALGPGTAIDVAAFKARYGVSRKYAIPLLEWLDRVRVTRRVGNSRVVL